MERCPIELWMKIAAFACTDGGYTGYALSLTSRTMRDIVKPSRYHSVSLTTLPRCLFFADLLHHLPFSPNIRHLFLSAPQDTAKRPSAEERDRRIKVLYTILRAAAPTLYSLTVHEPYTIILPDPPLTFPVLEDLSLPQLLALMGTPERTSFPALRRLHLSSCKEPRSAWDAIASLAPSVTHVRLNPVWPDADLCAFLRVLLDTPAPAVPSGAPRRGALAERIFTETSYPSGSTREDFARRAAARLSGVLDVLVQPPAAAPFCGWDYGQEDARQVMLGGLEDIARMCGERTLRTLRLLPETKGYSLGEARADWMDAVNGGKGPWGHSTQGLHRALPARHATAVGIAESIVSKDMRSRYSDRGTCIRLYLSYWMLMRCVRSLTQQARSWAELRAVFSVYRSGWS